MPIRPSGPYLVDAWGVVTAPAEVPDQTFVVTPAIEIVPNSGPAGTEIAVSGTGFGTGESGINVTYDAVVVAGPATATPDGIWGPLVFSAPAGASNVFHTVDAFGDTTNRFEVPNQIFTIEGTILVTPSTGTVGTLLTA